MYGRRDARRLGAQEGLAPGDDDARDQSPPPVEILEELMKRGEPVGHARAGALHEGGVVAVGAAEIAAGQEEE